PGISGLGFLFLFADPLANSGEGALRDSVGGRFPRSSALYAFFGGAPRETVCTRGGVGARARDGDSTNPLQEITSLVFEGLIKFVSDLANGSECWVAQLNLNASRDLNRDTTVGGLQVKRATAGQICPLCVKSGINVCATLLVCAAQHVITAGK